ncbi:Multidrug resistance-associated protein 4 [Folsomia candida]|uniref:Multidrug resistance-associated protein 4 n=1 Tax=Folsomia candida TaxID=158441 RepID=A0A226DNL4_FOLCA|nr:Multidrug resistance-associated protein 4 [Folsomia candida]
MDFKEKELRKNPRENANPLSTLFFWWINPLFRKGAKNDLAMDDLYSALKEDESERLGDQLEIAWKKQLEKKKSGKKPKLFRALISCFWKLYAFLVFGLMLDEWVVRIAQPLFLKALINSFSDGSEQWEKYSYAAGVCVTTLLHTLLLHPTMFANQHVGMKCRVAACSMIYRKVLKLSKRAQGKTTIGQMVNLLSNDVIRFDTNLMFIPYLLIGPVQIAIFGYFLYQEVEFAAFAGIGFVILLIPIEYAIGRMFTGYRFHIARRTDERGRIMSEIIIAMRVIKMYAWEKPFAAMINRVRKSEVQVLRKASLLRATYLSLYISSARMVTYFVFLAHILDGNPLRADVVFFCLTIFNTIRQVMISYFPTALAAISELFVSIDRIEGFLLLEEQKSNENEHIKIVLPEKTGEINEASIKMENVDASWTGEKLNLSQINFNFKGDKLVMVVGQVGCGKTTLLHTLLAELPITAGNCNIYGRTAYSSQESWIFGGNVKQNILFGQSFEEQRYNEVVRVCALEDDFKQLPHGDQTIVGERGVALSGGQKARVGLARAIYQKADIYLLDDPLSAVDSKVSRHIFEKCVRDHLTGHLRILCTHQLQYLPLSDHVIVLEDGKVLAQGTYQELSDRGVDFVSLMTSDSVDDAVSKSGVASPEEVPKEAQKDKGKPEAQVEKMAGGSVTWKTYFDYFRSGEATLFLYFVIFAFASSQVAFTAADYFLSMWTKAEEEREFRARQRATTTVLPTNFSQFSNISPNLIRPNAHDWIPSDDDGYLGEDVYLYSYTGIVMGIFFLTKARALSFFLFCMRVSVRVHDKMFKSMVRAPIKFYDDNPSGRIMNRFTKDLGSMDELLPYAMFDAITIFLLMLTMVALIISSNYYMAIPTFALLIILFVIRQYYIKTARAVKRIEALTRSPIFTHVVASSSGSTTIRSANAESILVKQFDGHQDIHSSSWYIFISANRWFGVWLEMISVAYLTIVTLSFLILASLTDYKSSDVGLAISSALNLTGVFQWGMRQSAETENLMTSVERALEYAKLDPEAPLESKPDKKPPKDWPKNGEIQFRNYYLAYEEKGVIKGITFDIKACEKIGIVGRTGAGKSSIINGLFRMTEPRGDMFIDGVRVNDIGLHDLRQAVSIIPQDPVLFSGSMRSNLDPFDQYPDQDLWESLEEVELKNDIPALDFKVSDGGSNFSVGQRQLVCLARAILRKNKIIVMDEATANVDPRLNSVMDCDRILVLDNGYLMEYNHPHILLNDPHGILSSMVNHTGAASAAVLKQVAAEETSSKVGEIGQMVDPLGASKQRDRLRDFSKRSDANQDLDQVENEGVP